VVHAHRLISVASAAVVIAGSGAAAARSRSASPRHTSLGATITFTREHGRPKRPDRADWERIRAASGLRRIGLEPHRTARVRAYAAFLGLSELTTIQPLGPGRCATAVIYLYNNLLDLQHAQPGENWRPLRALVAKEPSIRACAPPQPRRVIGP
jgi:hypothetical protein